MGARRSPVATRARHPVARPVPLAALLLTAAQLALSKAQAAAESAHLPPEDRVHNLRVALKRLRTYWRLARPHVSPVAWAHERDRLRALAAALAAFRDADVARAVVEAHVSRTGDTALHSLLKRWVTSKRALAGSPAARERALRSVARRMTNVVARLERAGGGTLTWEWLEPGLARSYRRGRQAWRLCRKGGNDTQFHVWRRRVKDLQYDVDLLRPLAPHRLGRLRRRIQKVAEALGEAHDLVELRGALERAFAAVRDHGWSSALSHNRRNLLERIQRAMAGKYRLALKDAEAVYKLLPKAWLHGVRKDWAHCAQKAGRAPEPDRAARAETDMMHGTRNMRMEE